MEALRVGGLVSGLDTNAIIDSMMAAAKEPINILNNQVSDLTYEKSVYNDMLTAMNGLKTALLPLKMESTFKSKNTTSSVPGTAGATASTNTPPGSYNLTVNQLAKPAFSTSIFTNKTLAFGGAGITGIENSTYPYDQTEGSHNVSIYKKSASQWIAKDVFESKNGQKYTKNNGAAIDSTLVDGNGKLKNNLTASVYFGFTLNGETKAVPVKMDYTAGTNLSVVAQDLEHQINAAIDGMYLKSGAQQLAVRTEMDETTGAFKFAMYDVSSENVVSPIGFMDPANTGTTPTATDTLMLQLGMGLATFDATKSLSKGGETTQIINMITSNNAANLQTKITDAKGGLFPGTNLKIASTGLEEGSFEVYQDSSANSRKAAKSTFYGGTLTAAQNITDDPAGTTDPKTAKQKIEKALKSPLKDNILFDTMPSIATNGTFTVNGIKIELGDYTKLSPNDLIAKINSSGAGVTASFDMETRTFKIENNVTGAGKITLGADGDTSNFLAILKLPTTAGGIYNPGQTEGNIDTGAKVGEAGFTYPTTSGIFTINGISIYVDITKDTVDDVMKKVNKSGAGVTMTYDQATDKFTLTSTNSNRIKLGGASDTSTFLQAAGLTYSTLNETEVGSQGSSAIFTVNGTKYERNSNEINDVVQGMSFSLYGTGSTVIKVEVNTDAAVEAFAEFASKYNEFINKLTPVEISKDDREKYADRLTDEDKKTMSEDDIKDYEKNYNAIQYYDIMHKSPELKRLKTTIRDQVFGTVGLPDNKYRSLSSMGILTAGAAGQDITITKLGLLLDSSTKKEDLAKYLKENTTFVDKVKNDSNEVYRFFSEQNTVNYVDPADGKTKSKVTSQGWSRSFDTYIVNNTTTTSALYKKAGVNGVIEQKIKSLKQQIETQTNRAQSYLERMWAQFSAMEQRVQNANTQASYITQISNKSA